MWLLLKNLIFTVLVPGTATVLVPWWVLAGTGRAALPAVGWLQVLALVPAVTALGIYLWCVRDFIVVGRGTPAPIDPPKALVDRGLYRVTRNPMYVGVLSMILAEALFFTSPWLLAYAAALFTVFHSFVVFYEEPTLRRLFGQAYSDYTTRVPRWLW
jgi:protein-S-isoprenylcysteine O-methyltransferase Ste14